MKKVKSLTLTPFSSAQRASFSDRNFCWALLSKKEKIIIRTLQRP